MSNFNKLRIHFHMSIGIANAAQEDSSKLSNYIDEVEWNELSPKEKKEKLQEFAEDWSTSYLDLGAYVE